MKTISLRRHGFIFCIQYFGEHFEILVINTTDTLVVEFRFCNSAMILSTILAGEQRFRELLAKFNMGIRCRIMRDYQSVGILSIRAFWGLHCPSLSLRDLDFGL